MKQTAVEFLEEQIRYYISNDDRLYYMFKQAKELENGQMIAFGKKCFYKGFEKAENDDANCFTAWREEANELLTFKSE